MIPSHHVTEIVVGVFCMNNFNHVTCRQLIGNEIFLTGVMSLNTNINYLQIHKTNKKKILQAKSFKQVFLVTNV